MIVTIKNCFNNKSGERMVTDMGMTNKQFQGFIRLALSVINEALKITPDKCRT